MPASVPDISVVIPCLNEEANAEAIAAAVAVELDKAAVSYEIIFIDNGSTDRTVELIKAMCAADACIRLIVNNQNYGQMRSPTYGIYQARGRAVIGICADFQDPPPMIGQFIARWRAGAKIVLGMRESEQASVLTQAVRKLGYGFLARFGDYKVLPGVTGFGLYDREVVDALAKWNEPEPFFRGMLVESGFQLETILHKRPARERGVSKNNFLRILDFGLSGIAGSSRRLLRLAFYVALASGLLTALTTLAVLMAAALGHGSWSMLIFPLVELNFTVLFGFVWLLGEQVRLISERTRNTPLVLEKERVNFVEPRP